MPLDDYFIVNEEGFVELGPLYGRVKIVGASIEQAQAMILGKLQEIFKSPTVTVELSRTGATQAVSGLYMVKQDGVVDLREYGAVHVNGMTLLEARTAIEKSLSNYFNAPQVSINIAGFNSKSYTIIREGSLSAGEDLIHLPIKGNETVLDALSMIGGLEKVSSTRMWIARPSSGNDGVEQILPIDYMAVTRGGSAATNYQIMPGDRLFIEEDGLVATNNFIVKAGTPLYQMFGITQLGAYTVRNAQILGQRH